MSLPLMPLGQGLRPYLLFQMDQVVGTEHAPQWKIEHLGYLRYLLSQRKTNTLKLSDGLGGENTVQVKYLQRAIPAMTSTTESCNNANFQAYREASVPLNVFRSYSLYYTQEQIARYTADASVYMQSGGTSAVTPIMHEILNGIAAGQSAVLQALNQDLLTLNVANIGTNTFYGNNTSHPINFTNNITTMPLNDGITKILSDFQQNLGSGVPNIVGNGLWLSFFTQQASKGMAQNGLNTKIEAANTNFFYDIDTQTILGTNDALVLEDGASQLVEYMKYEGHKAGRIGVSDFGTISLPYKMSPTEIDSIDFDIQIRELDCPNNTITNEYYGTTSTQDRGYEIKISKTCGLFQIPSDAYSAADRMSGYNGTVQYSATNV